MPRVRIKKMKTKFTTQNYIAAFKNLNLAPHNLRMLQVNFTAPNRTISATQMAKVMGYAHFRAANLHYGKLGRQVGNELGWKPLPQLPVNVLVDFKESRRGWLWIMKPQVASAMESIGWAGENTIPFPEEIDSTEPIYEGAVRKVLVNAYERSAVAREKCLLHYGCKCSICGIVLADVYGEIAQGFIHVHHLRQLADVNAKYQIDPVKDLRPICPTCHAVIHLRRPPFSTKEMKKFLKEKKK
jgi:putative restriction endonuclease